MATMSTVMSDIQGEIQRIQIALDKLSAKVNRLTKFDPESEIGRTAHAQALDSLEAERNNLRKQIGELCAQMEVENVKFLVSDEADETKS